MDNWQSATGGKLLPPECKPKRGQIATMDLQKFIELVEAASIEAGSQRKLADLLELNVASLIQMKQGKRPANWRVRGKLRVILGEDPTRAFVAAMAEDLAASENADEKKAADGFQAMLAAFPSDWRNGVVHIKP